mgnify:CR=1 FL=1
MYAANQIKGPRNLALHISLISGDINELWLFRLTAMMMMYIVIAGCYYNLYVPGSHTNVSACSYDFHVHEF